MPDINKLDSWISEQLKKGYTKQQLKDILAKRGYPASAVEEVDKVKQSSGTTAAKKYAKPLALVAIIIVGLIVLWAADRFQLFSSQKEQGSSLTPIKAGVNGKAVGTYSGTISSISATSITLTDGGKSKEFSISEENPPVFVIRGSTDRTAKVQPKVGDKVWSLSVTVPPKGKGYVERVIIDYQAAT
ncbi:hypothetical protein HYU17_04925 [Candidatus Woesearchaeota archaeon]|nr:hypothetical protein [Candidatus Woesearchaeota archaeon]